jgi:hypothetical protein
MLTPTLLISPTNLIRILPDRNWLSTSMPSPNNAVNGMYIFSFISEIEFPEIIKAFSSIADQLKQIL